VSKRTVQTSVALIVIAALAVSAGCGLKVRKRQTAPALQPKEDIAASPNQIRLRMRSLVDPFAGEIERTADRIVAGTSDPAVKRAAIKWKIEGVPALRSALFQPEPYTAALDTWVFLFQMEEYFDRGPGRVAFGDAAPLAVDTSRRLEGEFAGVVASLTHSKDVSKVRAFARQWATDHPMRFAIQDRESTLGRAGPKDIGADWSIGETVAEVAITVDDLHREIQIYSDHLFRQARWEAELFKLDLGVDEVLTLAKRAVKSAEGAVSTLDSLTPAIAGAANTASNLPAIVSSERKAVLDDVHQQLTGTLTFVRGERIASLEHITRERIAVLDHITQERIAALLQVSAERAAVMKELREIIASERAAVSREIEQAGVRLVDHAVWRIGQLLVAAFVAFLLTAILFLFLIRKLFSSGQKPRQWLPYDLLRGA
jgi:hypothetical protein